MAERNEQKPSPTHGQPRAVPGPERGTTFGQFVFLLLLVPVTVGILTGPLLGATIAGLATFDSLMLLLGFD